MAVIGAALRAHRWIACGSWAVALGVLGGFFGGFPLPIPLLEEPVAVSQLIIVAGCVVAVTPLHTSFPELAQTLPREATMRALRVLGSIVLLALPVSVLVLSSGTPQVIVAALTLQTIALVSQWAFGERSWLVIVAFGLVAIFLDAGPTTPVTVFLERFGMTPAVIAFVLTAIFVAFHHGAVRKRESAEGALSHAG